MKKWFTFLSLMIGLLLTFPLHAQDDSAVLYPGTYQAEDASIRLSDDVKIVDSDAAEGGKAVETIRLDFQYSGTDILVKWRGSSPLINSDCQIILPEHIPVTRDGWRYSRFSPWPIPEGTHFSLHTLPSATTFGNENPCLWVTNVSDETLLVDSVMVLDRTFESIFPALAAVGITIGMLVFVGVSALRERWRK